MVTYFAVFVSVCLCVRVRSGEAWERVSGVAAGMAGLSYMYVHVACGCLPPRCKGGQTMLVLSTVDAQLSAYVTRFH